MGSVFDVTAFVLRRTGEITPMKLQKLVYYGQAWSLVRDEEPLFHQVIQAWRHGPVCPPLYGTHAKATVVGPLYPFGNPDALSAQAALTIAAVLQAYGDKPAEWLRDLTHREAPWKDARGDLPLDASSQAVITHEAMRLYYATTESVERRIVMSFGRRRTPLVRYLEGMDDDDNAQLDELSDLDEQPEVAKLTAP